MVFKGAKLIVVKRSWIVLAAMLPVYWHAIAAGAAEYFRWVDDKGKGIELITFLDQFLKEMIGPDFSLKNASR